mmetsp:Transcript_16108/g.45558  ORF Transcript_16108/g.45558 Transcript_16108/m.45558 type:complete len:224 (+) Transcript_16108:334-1005(+)
MQQFAGLIGRVGNERDALVHIFHGPLGEQLGANGLRVRSHAVDVVLREGGAEDAHGLGQAGDTRGGGPRRGREQAVHFIKRGSLKVSVGKVAPRACLQAVHRVANGSQALIRQVVKLLVPQGRKVQSLDTPDVRIDHTEGKVCGNNPYARHLAARSGQRPLALYPRGPARDPGLRLLAALGHVRLVQGLFQVRPQAIALVVVHQGPADGRLPLEQRRGVQLLF